jgi:hypothetical protein
VVSVEDSGIWLACFDDTANDGGTRTLGQFGDPGEALEEFAALADRAAGRLGSTQAIGKADLFAGVLRYRAATTRADAARAALGDAIRRHQPRANSGDGLRPLWHEAGLSQESLGSEELMSMITAPGAVTGSSPARTRRTTAESGSMRMTAAAPAAAAPRSAAGLPPTRSAHDLATSSLTSYPWTW